MNSHSRRSEEDDDEDEENEENYIEVEFICSDKAYEVI